MVFCHTLIPRKGSSKQQQQLTPRVKKVVSLILNERLHSVSSQKHKHFKMFMSMSLLRFAGKLVAIVASQAIG